MVTTDTKHLLRRLFDALDWAALGGVYCEEGGKAFWAEHRAPALRLGTRWADALARRVRRDGRSLYVGAGVAELPAMVTEVVELGRTVVATNLRADEVAILEAGLAAVGVPTDGLRMRAADARAQAGDGPFDHIAVVSVLTDPELWPSVSAVTYGRVPPVLLDVDAFARERTAIHGLVDALLGMLAVPALVTTTVDEVPWLLHAAERAGLAIAADDEVVETAVVGDPIGFLAVTRAG